MSADQDVILDDMAINEKQKPNKYTTLFLWHMKTYIHNEIDQKKK